MNVTIPDEVYQEAARIAEAENISVSQVFTAAFTEHAAAWNRIRDRAARASRQKFTAVLDRVSSASADPNDCIE
jgi:hypothetical protein